MQVTNKKLNRKVIFSLAVILSFTGLSQKAQADLSELWAETTSSYSLFHGNAVCYSLNVEEGAPRWEELFRRYASAFVRADEDSDFMIADESYGDFVDYVQNYRISVIKSHKDESLVEHIGTIPEVIMRSAVKRNATAWKMMFGDPMPHLSFPSIPWDQFRQVILMSPWRVRVSVKGASKTPQQFTVDVCETNYFPAGSKDHSNVGYVLGNIISKGSNHTGVRLKAYKPGSAADSCHLVRGFEQSFNACIAKLYFEQTFNACIAKLYDNK